MKRRWTTRLSSWMWLFQFDMDIALEVPRLSRLQLDHRQIIGRYGPTTTLYPFLSAGFGRCSFLCLTSGLPIHSRCHKLSLLSEGHFCHRFPIRMKLSRSDYERNSSLRRPIYKKAHWGPIQRLVCLWNPDLAWAYTPLEATWKSGAQQE